ncbi:hypothetical protein ACFWTE_08905 [Nocardiopsis sp. NPDC058631]|uniref:hypothetical protein n=1 Tax=Nocardiopsis sp. NPDC058631 TaxID=3346566 RepID=UPI00365AFC0F
MIGAVAALVVVASLSAVVWTAAGGRPYADLPGCRQLLPAEVVDGIPGAADPLAEGDYYPAEETGYEEGGQIGHLACSVSDSYVFLLDVQAFLYDYEDGGEAVTDLREEMGDAREDLERDNPPEGVSGEVLDRRTVSAGDGGFAVLYQDEEYAEEVLAQASFTLVNVAVTISLPLEDGGIGEDGALDFLGDFAGQVERQISREAERA